MPHPHPPTYHATSPPLPHPYPTPTPLSTPLSTPPPTLPLHPPKEQQQGRGSSREPWDEEEDDGNWWSRPRRRSPDDECDWRRRTRALSALSSRSLSSAPRALTGGEEATQEAWLSEWHERLGCWWLALPVPAQGQLEGCAAALGLHLASRLDAALGRPPRQSSLAAADGCQGLLSRPGAVPELPQFPQIPRSGFSVPPLPRLLPMWDQLRMLHSKRQEEREALAEPPAPRWQAAAGAGAGVGVGAAALFAIGAALFSRRRPRSASGAHRRHAARSEKQSPQRGLMSV